jgi:RNA polymerase sigma factor (sigma-70 family)
MSIPRTADLAGLVCMTTPADAGQSDAQLVRRYIAGCDPNAFAALVRRHGPLVWGVCRRALGHHDAEDAFQATFLVLARRAASVRASEPLAGWLFGVARRTALKAQAVVARRAVREVTSFDLPEPSAPSAPDRWADAREDFDRELSRLPERYRVAIVLCDLEGRTRRDAAKQLGVPEGTLSGWLTRGRSLLARRLARYGLAVSGGMLARCSAVEGAPIRLFHMTARLSAVALDGGNGWNSVSINVARLAQEVAGTMIASKLKIVIISVVALAVLGAGTGVARLAHGQGPPAPAPIRQATADLDAARATLRQAEADLDAARARLAAAEAKYRQAQEKTGGKETSLPAPLAAALVNRFKYKVAFEIGKADQSDGGRIDILEVWGSRPKIEIGGEYIVRGRYTLKTQTRGKVYFYRTSTGSDGFGPVRDLQAVEVTKGMGEFVLLHWMGGPGSFHVQLAGADDDKFGTLADVYFGTGDNVWRPKE